MDDIKKEFIRFMEELHTQYTYPKNFFGCLMAILIEHPPPHQKRIMELTGYKRTTVSETLTKIQMSLPLKQIKIPGERKKFYKYGDDPTSFMMDFLDVVLESEESKLDYIPPILEEVSKYSEKHPRFRNFELFLKTIYYQFNLYFNLLEESKEEFKGILKTGNIDSSKIQELNSSRSEEMTSFIQKILKPSKKLVEFDESKSEMDKKLFEIYIQLKHRYYQKIREIMGPLRSQQAVYLPLIFQNILIEPEAVTQEEIEIATTLQRSIISEVLQFLVQQGLLKVFRKPGDLKKYYQNTISWSGLVLNRFKRFFGYTKLVKEKIKNLTEQLKTINDNSEEFHSLLTFFEKMYTAYDLSEQYVQSLQVKFLKILREHPQNGSKP
ncbi:MAG: hypothetical protein ACFFC7_32495 [Candidatus Hermodarchaeota archaeon]